ncbi:MAG: gluconate 2-dehydrogenase subunit 3 family protein [Segetibacter sp.]
MDRRKSIKALLFGTASSGVLIEACKNSDKKVTETSTVQPFTGPERMAEENAHYKEISGASKFFTDHEMATIAILADIIIPKDEVSGSATDAKVPDFIEFIVKEKTEHQTPMRGGLRWMDMYCLNNYGKTFRESDDKQKMALVDAIAYPKKAKPEMKQGAAFFSLIRNLTASGFYTSEIGVKDVGYMGNRPNQWNGVPADILKQYNMSYSEKELKECVSFDKV